MLLTTSGRRGAALVLAVVASAGLAGPAGPAQAAPRDLPPPTNGPWPPREVLADDPADVPLPFSAAAAAAAAVVNAACPAPRDGVSRSAPGSGKTVALTFDDGPGPGTMQILTILQRYGVTATFLNIGINERRRPAQVRAVAATGSALGNHTWEHPRMPTLTSAQQAQQMDAESTEQRSFVGAAPCLFRPPYGEYNATTVSLARARRMSVWNWSVDTEDWKAGTSTAQAEVDRIRTRAQAGGSQTHPVILMHNPPSGIPATVSALPAIIEYYRDRGYAFVDLLGRPSERNAPAAATTAGGVQLTERTATGALRTRTRSGSTWSAWHALAGNAVGGPASAAAAANATVVTGLGTDTAVWQRVRDDAGELGAWTDLGGTGTSKPAVAATSGRRTVAVRGSDGGIWLRELTAAGWGTWQSAGGAITGAPVAATTSGGALTIGGVGTDGALWVRHRAASGWTAWRRVGGVTTTEPALTAAPGGAGLVAMVRGSDGEAWVATGNAAASSWTGFRRVGGALTSGAALTAAGGGVVAFGYGTDGRIWENVARDGATAGDWTGWHAVP